MKKILYFLAFISLFLFTGCDECDCNHNNNNNDHPHDNVNKVLMLKVDYTTLTFEGGIEYTYNQHIDSFTIDVDYEEPGDFGSIRLTYQELNNTLFYGTIIWMGCGEMIFPESLLSANHFETVETDDVVYPINGFENILVDSSPSNTYFNIWMKVQNLVKVRQFLQSNPNQIVKLFLYTPSVGMGDPLDWDYFVFLKN